MSKKKKEYTQKEIVREQFLQLNNLQRIIKEINVVNDFHERRFEIGEQSQRIRINSYAETFDSIMYNNEYTILLNDDSMIIMQYRFDESQKIIGHTLSFLPNFRRNLFDEDVQSEEIKESQLFLRLGNYIRIDYDEQGQEEYYHSLIHMHIGTAKDTLRIPVEHFVLPFEFLFFVLKYVYRLPDEQLMGLECSMERESVLTKREMKKVRMAFVDQAMHIITE